MSDNLNKSQTLILESFRSHLESKGISKLSVKNYVSDVKKFLLFKQGASFCKNDLKEYEKYLGLQSSSPSSVKRYLGSVSKFLVFKGVNLVQVKNPSLAKSNKQLNKKVKNPFVTPLALSIATPNTVYKANSNDKVRQSSHLVLFPVPLTKSKKVLAFTKTKFLVYSSFVIASLLLTLSLFAVSNKSLGIGGRVAGIFSLNPFSNYDNVSNLQTYSQPTTYKGTGQVLANEDRGYNFKVNIPAIIDSTLNVTGPATFDANITAPNVLYSLTPGENITITGSAQNPVISGATSTSVGGITGSIALGDGLQISDNTLSSSGVTQFNGESGDVQLSAGAGININGLTISSTITQLEELDVEAFIFDTDNSSYLLPASGGTGLTTYTKGDILYSSAGDTLVALPIGAVNQALIVGAGGVPQWGSVVASDVAADTLDFEHFKDAMTLDASTDIALSSYDLSFNTNQLFLDSAGNVGIGESTPSADLDVSGLVLIDKLNIGTTTGSAYLLDIQTSQSESTSRFKSSQHVSLNLDAPDGGQKVIRFAENETLKWQLGMENSPSSITDDFIISQSNNPTTPEFIIKTSGNVGIGTTSPAATLDIGVTTGTKAFRISRSINNTEKFSITPENGWTQIEGEVLHINGQGAGGGVGLTLMTQGIDILELANASGQAWNSRFTQLNTARTALVVKGIASATADLQQWQDSSENPLVVISSVGNVGIGTTAPDEKLEVSGNILIPNDSIYASKNGAGTSNIQLLRLTPSNQFAIGQNSVITDTFIYGGGSTRFYFGGSESIRAGSTYLRPAINNSLSLGQDSLRWSDIYSVDGFFSGNVGIGTTAPANKLEVLGSQYAQLKLTEASSDATLQRVSLVGQHYSSSEEPVAMITSRSSLNTNLVAIGGYSGTHNAATQLSFYTGSTSTTTGGDVRMMINSSGNVGIGTTAPSFLLDVNGTGRFTGALRLDSTLLDINQSAGTSGQVLTSTGTGVDWVDSSTVGAFDGSGVANYVARWSATDTLTTGVLYDNGTNVGVGYASPSVLFSIGSSSGFNVDSSGFTAIGTTVDTTSKLKVQTSSSASQTYLRGGYIYSNLAMGGTATYLTGLESIASSRGNTTWGAGITAGFNNNTGSTVSTANSISLGLNNYDGTISTWNGIQISTPAIVSGSVTTARGIYVSNITGASNNYALITNAGNIVFNEGGDADTDFRVEGDTDSNLFFVNAGTERLGIGTAGPTYKLDINGTSNTVGVRVASSTANDILYYGTGTVTGGISLLSSGISATGSVQMDVLNTNSTSPTANSLLRLATTGANSGDPLINFSITGQQDWVVGVDNSDSDKFKIGYSSILGTNNAITINNSGNVGVGTADPSSKLFVKGLTTIETDPSTVWALKLRGHSSNGRAVFIISDQEGSSDNNYSSIFFDQVSNRHAIVSYSSGTNSNYPITFGFDSSGVADEVMRITPEGNLGIGTTAPTYKLDVIGGNMRVQGANASSSNFILTPGNGSNRAFWRVRTSSDPTNYSELYTDQAFGRHAFITSGSGTGQQLPISFNASLSEDILYIRPTGNVGIGGLNADDAPTLYVNSSNVGIGTTAPLDKLNVNGDIVLGNGSFGDNDIRFVSGENWRIGTQASAVSGGTLSGQALQFSAYDNSGVGYQFLNSSNDILFELESSSGKAYFTGNVGIGTTEPAAKLAVNGSILIPEATSQTNADNALLFDDGNTGIYKYSVSGFDRIGFTFSPSGAPIAWIGDQGYMTGYPSLTPQIQFSETASITNPVFVFQGDDNTGLGRAGTDILSLIAGGTNGLNVTSSGNVGIGTTAPSYKLDVNGTSRISDALTVGTGDASDTLTLINNVGTYTLSSYTFQAPSSYLINSGSTGYLQLSAGSHTSGITFYANGSERMRINSSGNVGIGTTNPAEKLDVNGNLKLGNSNKLVWGSNTNEYIGESGDSINYVSYSNQRMYLDSNNDGAGANVFAVLTGGTPGSATELFRVQSSGNVGIGTTAPSYKLDVNGTGRFVGALQLDTLASGSTDTVVTHSSGLLQSRTIDSRVWGTTLLDDTDIGVNIQAYDEELLDIASLTPTDGNFIVGNGTAFVAESGNTARTSLGLGTGDSPTFTDLALSGGDLDITPAGPSAFIADTFAGNTYKSYISFAAGSGSNDPGAIMHESSSTETNEGVLHLMPSDDNGYGDYVSIHGTNDPDVLKLHTDGTIEGVSTLSASSSITVAGNTVWHAGNDGAGSGLDADLLDGYNLSSSAGNSTVVQRTSAGYIYANYFNTTPNDVGSGVTRVLVETGNDGFMRHGTSAAIVDFITASDGSGSGLDADLLDGLTSASFLRSDANDTGSGAYTWSADTTDVFNFSANSTNDARGIAFNARTALSADYNDGWLRLNQGGEFTSGIYTPLGLRVDGELQQGTTDYGGYGIQTSSTIYANDYGVFMGGLHVGGTSDPGTDNLVVDGNIGIGVANPTDALVIREPSGATSLTLTTPGTGGTDQAQFELLTKDADGDGSFDAGDKGWVVSARGDAWSANTANQNDFGYLYYNGSGWSIPLFLGSDSKVGIGTETPGSYSLYVVGSAYSTGSWAGSDERWKTNIDNIENALSKVNKLQGVYYDWRVDEFPDRKFDSGRHLGFIAQQVESVVPELVHTDDDGYKAVSYGNMSALLIQAMKELDTKVAKNNTNLTKVSDSTLDRVSKLEKDLKDISDKVNSQTLSNLLSDQEGSATLTQLIADQVASYIESTTNLSDPTVIQSEAKNLSVPTSLESAMTLDQNSDLGIATNVNILGNVQITQNITAKSITSLSDVNVGLITIDSNDNSINALGSKLLIQSKDGSGEVSFFNDKLVVTTDGGIVSNDTIQAKKVIAEQIEINVLSASETNEQSAGKGLIKKGTSEITINTSIVTPDSIVIITPETVVPYSLAVVDKVDGESFTVKIPQLASEDIKFSWLIVGVRTDVSQSQSEGGTQ